MGDQESRRESRFCPWCGESRMRESESDYREATKDMDLGEGASCRQRRRAREKYLQIPTFRRWGRQLS